MPEPEKTPAFHERVRALLTDACPDGTVLVGDDATKRLAEVLDEDKGPKPAA